MILITGASGMAGGAVMEAAIARGLPVRAMYRTTEEASRAPANISSVVADYADRASLTAALEGVDRVYIVCGPIPQLIEFESGMIDACVAAGVDHVVLNSALGAGKFGKSFPSWHYKVEEKLRESGLPHTIVRPNGFAQNIVTYNAASIKSESSFYAAMGTARVSLIDVRDVGAVVALILAHPAPHRGHVYELNGPEALSNGDIAEMLSRLTGSTINYIDIPEESQRQAMLSAGMPEWQVNAILELQEYYRSGTCAEVDGQAERLLGHPARTVKRFLEENLTAFHDGAARQQDAINSKTGMRQSELKAFIRNHFEEFVNRQNIDIADINFAPGFVDHGADVPPGLPPGPAGAKAYVGSAYKRFPDIHVEIEDMIAEDDKVAVRNHWTGTEAATGQRFEFSGIVIWRVEARQIHERWAYLQPPHHAD